MNANLISVLAFAEKRGEGESAARSGLTACLSKELGWKIFFSLPFQYRGFDAFSVSQGSKWVCFSCSKGLYYSYNHFDNSSNNIFDKRISILNISKMKNVEK